MRMFSDEKIGQSGKKFALSVFFSFFLHVLLFAASILMMSVVRPRTYIPPSYQVKLVGQPSDLTRGSQAETAPAAPKKEEKAKKESVSRKEKKAISKQSKAALKKGAMPELVEKQKKAVPEPSQQEIPQEPAAGPTTPQAKSGGTTEGVAVGTTSSEFKFPPYLAIVREKIEQNWNPPPSSRNVTAKVLFKILRSGRVDDPKLEKSSGQFYFDQAAIRAILLSSPFPPLPEGFYKDYEVFSVDLMEKE